MCSSSNIKRILKPDEVTDSVHLSDVKNVSFGFALVDWTPPDGKYRLPHIIMKRQGGEYFTIVSISDFYTRRIGRYKYDSFAEAIEDAYTHEGTKAVFWVSCADNEVLSHLVDLLTEIYDDEYLNTEADYPEYPSNATLRQIENYWLLKNDGQGTDPDRLRTLIQLIKRNWRYYNPAWNNNAVVEQEEGDDEPVVPFYLATCGWSGNESIIDALRKNCVFWSKFFWTLRAGGGYTFHFPEEIKDEVLANE